MEDCYIPLDILFTNGNDNPPCYKEDEGCVYCCDGQCLADEELREPCYDRNM